MRNSIKPFGTFHFEVLLMPKIVLEVFINHPFGRLESRSKKTNILSEHRKKKRNHCSLDVLSQQIWK